MTYTNNQCHPWVGFTGNTGVSSEHQSSYDDDGEDEHSNRCNISDDGEGSELDIVRLGSGDFDFVRHG